MTIVVGFGPDVRSTGGLRLAGQLALAAGSPLVLCCVVHDAFDMLRDAHHVDAEWRGHLESSAREAIATAQEVLPDGLDVETVVRAGRSVPQVLREEGERRHAELLVAGSGRMGNLGRIALGSTTDRLVHGSGVPVALAPRGYQPDGAPQRLVFAMEPTTGDVALAGSVADLAARLGTSVQVATFVVRPRSAVTAFRGGDIFRAWSEEVHRSHREVAAAIRERGGEVSGSALLEAESWSGVLQAPDWRSGDLLVMGSSRHGPVTGVFLGSTAARILRHAPAPVVVLPR